jgi:hypothetical protein
MQLQKRIKAFSILGRFMCRFGDDDPLDSLGIPFRDQFLEEMSGIIEVANNHNGWFTSENIRYALKSWSEVLHEEQINKWLAKYKPKAEYENTVAIIMAGNIPLVGFHDFISVLLSGNKVLVKLSSNDTILLPFLAKALISIEEEFKDLIQFTDDKLTNFDGIIATGSNNTARYFEYYFGKYPNIIRKNRNSVAVLTGKETPDQMKLLANDIFRYYGLGCRNVSKIFIPEKYNFDSFFNAMYNWKHVINQNKYMNNYDYNKAVYLMSNIALLDNEFMLLKEDTAISSPISIVYYEYYTSLEELKGLLKEQKDQIQCIVSESGLEEEIPFGTTQSPALWDYADGVDTLNFLLKITG